MYVDSERFKFSFQKLVGLNILIMLMIVLSGCVGWPLSEKFYLVPVWCPGGIALAAILLFGLNQVLCGLTLGFLLLTFTTSSNLSMMTGMFIINLLGPIISALYLTHYGRGAFRFSTIKDVFNFGLIAALLTPFVVCTLILVILLNSRFIDIHEAFDTWTNLYVSHVLGVSIFTPLIASFFNIETKKLNKTEAMILFISLASVAFWSFSEQSNKKILVIPLLTWGALRFGVMGVGLSTLIFGAIAVWSSIEFNGIFDSTSPQRDLFWIQCMSIGATLVGYFLATGNDAHERAEEKALESVINLEHKKIAEEALALLDQSLQKSPIGFSLVDKKFRFIRINERLAFLNGMPAFSHLGKSIRDMAPAMADDVEPLVERVFLTGESYLNLPVKIVSRSRNQVIYGLVSYYPVKHPMTEEIFAVTISFQDVSTQTKIQKLLEENQARLNFAHEAGKSGAFEWCLLTNKIFWTSELESIYDINPGEFGGLFESWMKWIHPGDAHNVRAEMKRVALTGAELNVQFRILTRNNETRWILARGKKMIDEDGREKVVGINLDFTEQKNFEQKLKVTEANLLHALSVRDEFMGIASHELKTPLTSLKLQTEIFQRNLTRNDFSVLKPEKMSAFMEKNLKQVDRLTRLVDDMLDISRIRTGRFSLKREECNLKQILNDILDRTSEQFRNSGSGMPLIEHLDEVVGEWDPLRIEQVITNIITNAIRYGGGKPITVSINEFNESVRISVKDQGLGIPQSDHLKIFQRYERGLLARGVSGLGLGLFISQQIVHAHGGKIWVESELNRGATFFIELPLKVTYMVGMLTSDETRGTASL